MKTVSDYRRLNEDAEFVTVFFQEKELRLRKGENLAAELLVAGIVPFRNTPVSGAPRNPFCMMGACFDCLVQIDGETRQACMERVNKGMEISMPHAKESDDA